MAQSGGNCTITDTGTHCASRHWRRPRAPPSQQLPAPCAAHSGCRQLAARAGTQGSCCGPSARAQGRAGGRRGARCRASSAPPPRLPAPPCGGHKCTNPMTQELDPTEHALHKTCLHVHAAGEGLFRARMPCVCKSGMGISRRALHAHAPSLLACQSRQGTSTRCTRAHAAHAC